jgi:DNA-binding ferritin-like protein
MDDRQLKPQQRLDEERRGAACDVPQAGASAPQSSRSEEDRQPHPKSGNWKEQATETLDSTLHSAGERAKAAASEAYQRTKETLKQSSAEAAERIQGQGSQWAAAQRNRLVDELSHVGHAFREATNSLRQDQDHNVAACTEFVAERTEQVADYLRSSNIHQFRGDVERFARRRPEVFFGGMFLVGLALSRFLKARPVTDADDSPLYDPHEEGLTREDDPAYYDWSAT